MSTARPHRRFTLEIRITADTLADVSHELDFLAGHIPEHGAACDSVKGGPTSGHIVTIKEDPEMTPEKYFASLEKWIAREDKGKDPKEHRGDDDCG